MRRLTLATTALLALAIAAASGCSLYNGSIDGEIDGEIVPAFSDAIWYRADDVTLDDHSDFVAIGAFYSFNNACDLAAQQLDTKADAIERVGERANIEDVMDDVSSFERESLPEDYWAAYVLVSARNAAGVKGNFDVDKDEAGVVVCHHTGAVDAANDNPIAALVPDYGSVGAPDRNRECFTSTSGEVRVSIFNQDSFGMVAPVDLEDEDGDRAGRVELGGIGRRCEEAEDAAQGMLDEMIDILGDSATGTSSAVGNNSGDSGTTGNSGNSGSVSSGGDDSCEFALDNECDEASGFCAPGTDTTDCRNNPNSPNSCQFAFDGECDEPQACAPGTDTVDCG